MAGCIVPSSDASKRTVKWVTEGINKVRTIVSGGDTTVQFAAEIKINCPRKSERDYSTRPSFQLSFPQIMP